MVPPAAVLLMTLAASAAVPAAEARFENLEGRIDWLDIGLRTVTAPTKYDQSLAFSTAALPVPGLSGTSVTFGGSCGVAYTALPFTVACRPTIALGLPDNGAPMLQNPGPLVFESLVGLVLGRDNADTRFMELDLQIGAKTPLVDFNTGWLEAFGFDGKVQPVAVPPTGAASITLKRVQVPDLSQDTCLFQFMPTLVAPVVPLLPQLAPIAAGLQKFGAITGTDICMRFQGLAFNQTGMKLKLFLSVHFVDDKLMTALGPAAKRAVIALRNALLKRDAGIVLTQDLGAALFALHAGRRDLAIMEALEPDGTFVFGDQAHLPTPAPTRKPSPLPSPPPTLPPTRPPTLPPTLPTKSPSSTGKVVGGQLAPSAASRAADNTQSGGSSAPAILGAVAGAGALAVLLVAARRRRRHNQRAAEQQVTHDIGVRSSSTDNPRFAARAMP
jgi:MYXO-CTERM domain-containing protein